MDTISRIPKMHKRQTLVVVLHRIVTAGVLVAGLCYAGLAQSVEYPGNPRRKGWSASQVQNWIEDQSYSRLMQDPFCPDYTDRRDAILNGNKITTQIFNFGSISSPGNVITDIVWNGLGYGYEFGPFVAAEVIDEGHRDSQSVPKRDDTGRLILDALGDTVWTDGRIHGLRTGTTRT